MSLFSSKDESSDDRTITADSNSSATLAFKEMPCEWEANLKGIKATLHQIADSSTPYGCPNAYLESITS